MQTCRHTKKSPTCIRTKFRATVLVLRTKGGRRTTTAAAHAPSVETGCGKFVTNVPSFGKFRSREVTVCDGTFPDFATSLHGQDTRIGRRSFGGRETGHRLRQPQALHLPDATTYFDGIRSERTRSSRPDDSSRISGFPPGSIIPGRRNPETCTTSLPSSRPGSDPWRPSRGTGYG